MADNRITRSLVVNAATEQEKNIRLKSLSKDNSDGLSLDALVFPKEVFPLKIRNIFEAICKYEDLNPDFLGCSILAVFAAAMGNSWKAQFSTTMVCSPVLFMALIGPPSCGKTPPLELVMAPLQKIDAEMDQQYNAARAEYEHQMGMSQKERVDAGLPETPVRPPHRKHITNNTTVEQLITTLADNPCGVLTYVDELSSLLENLDRYGKGSDEGFWLQVFNSSQIKYERKTGDYANIMHPYVSIVGGTQPAKLYALFGGKHEGSGLASRFLKVYPDAVPPQWKLELMPGEYLSDWEEIIRKVVSVKRDLDPNNEIISKVLTFHEEARVAMIAWDDSMRKLWEESNSYMCGVIGKLRTYLVRFSLIIHVMRIICGETKDECIDNHSAELSMQLTTYFYRMELMVYDMMSCRPKDEFGKKLLDTLPEEFTTAEAIKAGIGLGKSERTVKRFLRDGDNVYLNKQSHGVYCKKK